MPTNVDRSVHSQVSTASSKRQSRRTSAPGGLTSNPISSPPATKTNYKREIAALEFLLGIPMEAERDIVHQGWLKQHGLVEDIKTQGEPKVDVLEPPLHTQTREEISGSSHHERWWEKWVNNPSKLGDISRRSRIEEEELEQPHQIEETNAPNKEKQLQETRQQVVPMVHAPGRRLEGDEAIRIQIPLKVNTITRQKHIARMAATREWEREVAHGIGDSNTRSSVTKTKSKNPTNSKKAHPPMLDGRMFFSAAGSYPHEVFSIIRYEPKKEEAARRRQKLEARGGGGSQFIMPARDWRGISYRALLPTRNTRRKGGTSDEEAMIFFDRFATTNTESEHKSGEKGRKKTQDDTETKALELTDDESDEEPDTYVAGLLDDPKMVRGRHRNVMIGDRTTGCIVSSMIQFVQPALLKADLNKKFKERFDGWEPPKSQRKYIGARVIDGSYTLMEPGLDDGSVATASKDLDQQSNATGATIGTMSTAPRNRQGSVSSISTGGDPKETIRMPPSLTLSKIRSLKQQALLAAVKARLEISTVALAIIYFERLCLDCRVDKTNRRLSFAACLLLAIKINEAHVGLVTPQQEKEEEATSKNFATMRIQSVYRPTEKSSTMFASLLEVFTQEWEISLKHLYAAEWGVFAALQFRLHAKPSQVAFHFKRLLKSLDWNPRRYLGGEMFNFWQKALAREEYLLQERDVRMELRQQKKEQKKLMQLQMEIGRREKSSSSDIEDEDNDGQAANEASSTHAKAETHHAESQEPGSQNPLGPRKGSRLSLAILNRFSGHGKRSHSTDRLTHNQDVVSEFSNSNQQKMSHSPSMPALSKFLNQDHQLGTNAAGEDDGSAYSHSETSVIMI